MLPAKTASPSSAKRSAPGAGSGAGRHGGGIAKQRQLLDAADGGLHDGSPDGRLRLRAAAAVHLKNAASPANGKFVDASGKSYGPATAGGRTMTVPKTAMAPKPAVTNTVTRGGFGETVAKQTSMQRSSATSNSGSRSMGG